MTTIVCFHAHPDDESIGTGGTIARAVAAGHRVVLVLATRGERGEPTPGVLAEGEMLWERRIVETLESARLLGVERVEFLGYVDSGMMGEPTNDFPYSFWQADVEHAASRLAAILPEEDADILTVYDDFGGYGHPDHIQVHRVGLRAAQLAGTPEVFQGTMNADHIRRTIATAMAQQAADGIEPPENAPTEEDLDANTFGKPEVELTHAIDVSDLLEVEAGLDGRPRQPDRPGLVVPDHVGRGVRVGVRHRVVHPHRPHQGSGRAVRHDPVGRGVILDLHDLWSWVVVIGNGLAGAWCLGAHWVPALRVKALWVAVVVVQVTIFVQVALGVYMVAVQGIEAPGMHMFYGFISLVTVGILYAYRGQLRAQTYLLYGFGGLFLMGLGIRAMFLA